MWSGGDVSGGGGGVEGEGVGVGGGGVGGGTTKTCGDSFIACCDYKGCGRQAGRPLTKSTTTVLTE